ncbi:MAG: response regulator [Spirochaetia bacterium]|nr:response regulator [Spirochaetia bacterium]
MKYSILVVDDIESIRYAIRDFLKPYYEVYEAEDGYAALAVMEKHQIEFVLTDIRMPGMGGLELIAAIRERYPHVLYALMTAYNVNDYVQYARIHKIWNIIPKTTFLDLRFIHVMLDKLLTGNIFGAELYFPGAGREKAAFPLLYKMAKHRDVPLKHGTLYVCRVETAEENSHVSEMVGDILHGAGAPTVIRQVLEEITSNAISWAPGKGTGKQDEAEAQRKKSQVPHTFSASSAYELGFGILEENAVISVTDYHGTLDREEILYRLERHVTLDENGLPLGLGDSHGRGLFISREHMDHLVFNIEPGVKSEVIGILSLEPGDRNRALSIFQTTD